MHKYIFPFLFLSFIVNSFSQSKVKIDYFSNAENLNSFSDDSGGTILDFKIYNKYNQIGYGGGWLIYKEGTLKLHDFIEIEYNSNKYKGISFIKDVFEVKNIKPYVDSSFLKLFVIYLYLIPTKYLEHKLNTDGEGAGITYSYKIKFPCEMCIYKEDQNGFFNLIQEIQINSENDYTNTISLIEKIQIETSIKSNLIK